MGVWIETKERNKEQRKTESHPSWVCGLKQSLSHLADLRCKSHPSWVCGLKQLLGYGNFTQQFVTPFMGVWIETRRCGRYDQLPASHPSWVCGLKLPWQYAISHYRCHTLRGCVDWNLLKCQPLYLRYVTPFMGVWIETRPSLAQLQDWSVTPFMSVWIETYRQSCQQSPPWSHTLHGCVDWNCFLPYPMHISLVTPFMGVWIETQAASKEQHQTSVTPFMGVWIETLLLVGSIKTQKVTPFMGVWIETPIGSIN